MHVVCVFVGPKVQKLRGLVLLEYNTTSSRILRTLEETMTAVGSDGCVRDNAATVHYVARL